MIKLTVMNPLFNILKTRFENNMGRHANINWEHVMAKLRAQPDKVQILEEMEATGGEPDVIGHDVEEDAFVFFDCAPESPKGRRSLCYDPDALQSRKEHKPKGSAMGMAAEMQTQLLTEEQYIALQKLGAFDLKTSSWLKTPEVIRSRGGAIFGDRRYGRIFIYHNGAESYYGARGFRVSLYV